MSVNSDIWIVFKICKIYSVAFSLSLGEHAYTATVIEGSVV